MNNDLDRVWNAMMGLAEANDTSVGQVWEYEVSDWCVFVNGSNDMIEAATHEDRMAVNVKPHEVAVWHGTLLVGIFNPLGGEFAHSGEANLDAFVETIEEHVTKLEEAD